MVFKTLQLIFLLGIIASIYGCNDPLEKTYNSETFVQDLDALEEPNRTIVKNIIDRFERYSDEENIAGTESVLIQSTTFRELINNYKTFHKIWREKQIEELKSIILKSLSIANNPEILASNLQFVIDSEQVRNPENNYIARKLSISHKFNEPLSLGGIVRLDLTKGDPNEEEYEDIVFVETLILREFIGTDEMLDVYDEGFIETDMYIYPDREMIKYIDGYRIPDHLKPTSEREMNILGFFPSNFIPSTNNEGIKRFIFAIGDKLYDLQSNDFLMNYSVDGFKDMIESSLEHLEELVSIHFSLEVWPYDNEVVKTKRDRILESDKFILEYKSYLEAD